MGHLYYLEQFSFSTVTLTQFNNSALLQQYINSGSLRNSDSFPQICTITSDDEKHLWHSRMGQPSDQVLEHLPFSFNTKPIVDCDICPLAKQTRKTFPHSFIQTPNPFELIHVDIWGPYNTPTLSGASYFLTIVDDYTRATWTYLMACKN